MNETSALNESETARDGKHGSRARSVIGRRREKGAINPIVMKQH